MKMQKLSLLALICLLLAACGTPQAVRDQSALVSAQIAVVSAELQRFAGEEKRLADQRSARILDLHRAFSEVEERRALRLLASQKQLLDTVMRKVQQTEARRNAEQARAAELSETLRKTAATFSVPKSELESAQQAFARLAKPRDEAARLNFLLGFVGEVAKNFQEMREKSEEAAAAAVEGSEAQEKSTIDGLGALSQ